MIKKIAQAVCFVFGLLLFSLYFSSAPSAKIIYQKIVNDYWQIIFAFTLIVGVVSFLRINLQGIARGNDRPYRIVSLLGLFLMPLLAIIWGIGIDEPFMWVFENVQVPMQSTVFALLAFFVVSASFRGFRARSVPAGILLAAALIALLSRSTFGEMIWDQLPFISDWLRSYPSMAARRAILIGIGLGSITISLRVIVGIERTWLGGSKA